MKNSDEILQCENMIKSIEDELSKVNRKINNNKDMLLKHKISVGILNPFLLILGISSIATQNYSMLFIPGIFSIGLIVSSVECHEIRKILNGLRNTKIYLQNEHSREKTKLVLLKTNKEKNVFNENNLYNNKSLSDLNNSINFEYNLGYNEKEYFKYYNNGTLKDKLKADSQYSFYEINEIENHFKNKTLMKKKR